MKPPLYKYFKINKYSINSLKNNSLFFSNPITFNDPFDCQVDFNILNRTQEDYAAFIYTEGDVVLKSKSEFKLVKDEMDSCKELLASEYLKTRKSMGVSCLSERVDSILMWSHYANCHTGFCLGLDFNVDFSDSGLLNIHNIKKVEYPVGNHLPELDPLLFLSKNNSNYMMSLILNMFATKANDWAYEKEWRLIVENGGESINLPTKSFKSIYFGLNTSESDVNKIINLRPDLDHYKAERCDKKLAIKFVKI